jgi:hypothetical protein
METAPGQLATVHQVPLERQEAVDQGADRHRPVVALARHAPGIEVVFLFQVAAQGRFRLTPDAEIVELPPDLLAPSPGRMRGEGKVRVGLAGLLGACRLDHSGCS